MGSIDMHQSEANVLKGGFADSDDKEVQQVEGSFPGERLETE